MNKFTLSIASILFTTFFINPAFALDAKSVAAVNGKNISQKQYQTLLKQVQSQNKSGTPAQVNRQLILDELINREVLFQEANKLKLSKDKQVKKVLKQQKRNLLIQTLLSRSPAAKPISEKELKAFYSKQVAGADTKEYKTRHILVKDEASAKKLITKLNDGASFKETAKNESIDPSGKNGGDLGWMSPAQMPPAYHKAVIKLKKGTLTQKPVKTRFGFHVVKLDESRKRQAPPYADAKAQIRAIIQRQRVKKYIVKLRNKAKIEVK
jgi:peptidyl-prolyl cis-trans isomerase C